MGGSGRGRKTMKWRKGSWREIKVRRGKKTIKLEKKSWMKIERDGRGRMDGDRGGRGKKGGR